MTEKQVRDFGPNKTTKREAPPIICPVCGEVVQARLVAEHGKRHRADYEAK